MAMYGNVDEVYLVVHPDKSTTVFAKEANSKWRSLTGEVGSVGNVVNVGRVGRVGTVGRVDWVGRVGLVGWVGRVVRVRTQ